LYMMTMMNHSMEVINEMRKNVLSYKESAVSKNGRDDVPTKKHGMARHGFRQIREHYE